MGPTCLYKLLGNRFADNPSYLQRNIRQQKRERNHPVSSSIEISGKVEFYLKRSIISKVRIVSAYLVLKRKNMYELQRGGKYLDINAEQFVSKPLNIVQCQIDYKFEVDKHILCNSSCAFIMLLASDQPSMLHHRKIMINAMTNFTAKEASKRILISEGADIRCNVGWSSSQEHSYPFAMIDISFYLERVRQQMGNIYISTESVYRLFMDVMSSQSCAAGSLRNEQHCRLFFPLDSSCGEIQYKLSFFTSLSPPDNRRKRGAKPSTSSSTKNSSPFVQPKQRMSTSTEESSNLVFHYQVKNKIDVTTREVNTTNDEFPLSEKLSSNSIQPKHYIWHETLTRIGCPWCGAKFRMRPSILRINEVNKIPTESTMQDFEVLVQHLLSHHYHFQYQFSLDAHGTIHILVQREFDQNKQQEMFTNSNRKKRRWDTAFGQEEFCFFRNFVAPQVRLQFLDENRLIGIPIGTRIGPIVPLEKQSKKDSGKVLEKKTSKKIDPRLQPTSFFGRPNRVSYFHTVSGQPLTVDEIGYDSENELDGLWELKLRNQEIDEYTDITLQEKLFMKLWNSHLTSFPPYGDRLLPVVCETFIECFTEAIVQHNLRHNLALHLINLWDYGLLLTEEVQYYLHCVDLFASQRLVSIDSSADENC